MSGNATGRSLKTGHEQPSSQTGATDQLVCAGCPSHDNIETVEVETAELNASLSHFGFHGAHQKIPLCHRCRELVIRGRLRFTTGGFPVVDGRAKSPRGVEHQHL